MEKMKEKDFANLSFEKKHINCKHENIVKLYYLSTHTEYGCLGCGATHSEKEFFMNKRGEFDEE